MPPYLLPFHPDLRVQDRLGILDVETESVNVSQATALRKLFADAMAALAQRETSVTDGFIELLDTIAYTIHGNGDLDTCTLKRFLEDGQDDSRTVQAIQNIVASAIDLERVQVESAVEQLSINSPCFRISASAAKAILAHESLGTLNPPDGNDWGLPGFLSWYAGSPRHPNAVDGYLRILFSYFEQENIHEAEYTFQLCLSDRNPDPGICYACPNFEICVVEEIQEPVPEDIGILHFTLVAANKQPGPGPTGTQEERMQAMSPILTLSSLICPIIPEDAAIVTSALPVLGCWTGHNRSVRLIKLFSGPEKLSRRYIFADALPLDEVDIEEYGNLPDFLPGNIDREIRKLYAAFSSARLQAEKEYVPNYIVEVPPWGCGAFGGNLLVKTLCMMVAAGLSQVRVRLNVVRGDHDEVVTVLQKLLDMRLTVATMAELLHSSSNRTQQDLIDSIERLESPRSIS